MYLLYQILTLKTRFSEKARQKTNVQFVQRNRTILYQFNCVIELKDLCIFLRSKFFIATFLFPLEHILAYLIDKSYIFINGELIKHVSYIRHLEFYLIRTGGYPYIASLNRWIIFLKTEKEIRMKQNFSSLAHFIGSLLVEGCN